MARTGRYSHQLIASEYYQTHSSELWSWTSYLAQLGLSEPDFVCAWVLGIGISAKGFEFLQPHPSYKLVSDENLEFSEGLTFANLIELLKTSKLVSTEQTPWKKHAGFLQQSLWQVINHCELRGLPRAVRSCLLNWRLGHYPLKLFRNHISSEEVFQMQKNFRRCVAVFSEKSDFLELHHGRDAWAFTIHDLIHAENFYQNPLSSRQQVGFLNWVDKVRSQNGFAELLTDSAFQNQFEYLVSDMNAYCGHLVKTLHALVVQTQDRLVQKSELTWPAVVSQTVHPGPAREAFLKVNQNAFQLQDFKALEDYFLASCPL